MQKTIKTFCAAVVLFTWATSFLLADQPQIAENVSFQVPLADGKPGTALLLAIHDGQVMVVAKDGSPPVLALYRVVPGPSPQPGPGPGPGPGPQPEPGPQPQPQGPLSLIWIEESADRTPEQAQAIVDPEIREVLREAGWTLRVADDDVVDEHGQAPSDLQQFIAAARQAGLPRLFAVNAQGAEVFAGKAPKDAAEFKALLKWLGLPIEVPAEPPPADGEKNENSKQQSASACSVGKSLTTGYRARFRLFR